jgi:hypothetical protein
MSEKSANSMNEKPRCAPAEPKNSLLTKVFIEGLLGVGNVELRFAPGQRVHVLFGENGVGKTKCLEALYLNLLRSNEDFAAFLKRKGIGPVKWWPVAHYVADKDKILQYTGGADGSPEEPQWYHHARLSETKDAPLYLPHRFPVVFIGAGRRADFEEMRRRESAGPLGTFEDRKEKYFSGLADAIASGHLGSLGMSGDIRAWFVARAQADNPYQKSKDNRKAEIDTVLSMLHEMEPCIDPKGFQTEDGRQVGFQIDGDENVFLCVEKQQRGLDELSSGYAALVKMTQAVIAGYAAFTNEKQLRNVRGIVLIDEIDSHLHPEWQARIIPRLKDLLPNTTFYIATHSPLVLVQLLHGEAYLLKRGDDGVVRGELIRHPGRRLFIDVLDDAMSVDLNKLKRDMMEYDDQTDAKQGLLALLDSIETREKAKQ